jgi:hypothetical protein
MTRRTALAGFKANLAHPLLILLGLGIAAESTATTTVNLLKTISTAGPVESGQTFNYNLTWSCPGSVSPADDCVDMTIVESLPSSLQATALPESDGRLGKVCVQNPGDGVPDYLTCTQPSVSAG